jgi:hypothetical protein
MGFLSTEKKLTSQFNYQNESTIKLAPIYLRVQEKHHIGLSCDAWPIGACFGRFC